MISQTWTDKDANLSLGFDKLEDPMMTNKE